MSNTIAERLAQSNPAPPWMGLPAGTYARETGSGVVFVHPDGETHTWFDPMGRRVTARRAAPQPEPVVVPDPRELLHREPRDYEEFCRKVKLVEVEILAGRRPMPTPTPVVEERPATLEADPGWQQFMAGVQAWLASPEYAEQLERSVATSSEADRHEAQRLTTIANSDGRGAARASDELDRLRQRVETRSARFGRR